MSAVDAEPQTLADVLDTNVRINVRTLLSYSELPARVLYGPLHMSRQRFSAKLTGSSRFTAAEVAMLAHLLGVTADRLYADPDEYVRADPTSEPRGDLRRRLLEELGASARSRCFSLVPMLPGPDQLVLPGIIRPDLAVAV